jgi:hypothetical protein
MTGREIQPLAIMARAAFDFQTRLGNIDAGTCHHEWRRAEVMAITGCHGLRECTHAHYKPLEAHFLALAGRDAEAFQAHMRNGPARDSNPHDTHEDRRQIAHQIVSAVQAHEWLADHSLGDLLADPDYRARAADYVGAAPKGWLRKLRDIHAAISAHGPVRLGYVVAVARAKTRKPRLQLGPDVSAGLADRLTTSKLAQIRNTIVNRIAAVEGRGSSKSRNRSQAFRTQRAADLQDFDSAR